MWYVLVLYVLNNSSLHNASIKHTYVARDVSHINYGTADTLMLELSGELHNICMNWTLEDT